MIIKVKHLQEEEIHVLSSNEFFMYLAGYCSAGRRPELHVISLKTKNNYPSSDSYSLDFCDYEVIIVDRN